MSFDEFKQKLEYDYDRELAVNLINESSERKNLSKLTKDQLINKLIEESNKNLEMTSMAIKYRGHIEHIKRLATNQFLVSEQHEVTIILLVRRINKALTFIRHYAELIFGLTGFKTKNKILWIDDIDEELALMGELDKQEFRVPGSFSNDGSLIREIDEEAPTTLEGLKESLSYRALYKVASQLRKDWES